LQTECGIRHSNGKVPAFRDFLKRMNGLEQVARFTQPLGPCPICTFVLELLEPDRGRLVVNPFLKRRSPGGGGSRGFCNSTAEGRTEFFAIGRVERN
jgi:hypothetical protein